MRTILIFLSFLLPFCSIAQKNEMDSLLHQLDIAIQDHKTYMSAKETRISNLKNFITSHHVSKEQAYSIHNQLFNEYIIYNIDSALHFLNLNLEISESLGKPEWINETKFKLARVFTASGMYKEAMDMLESIDQHRVSDLQKNVFYASYEHLYDELSIYTRSRRISEQYKNKAKKYQDTLFLYLDKNTDIFWYHYERLLFEKGNVNESLKINMTALSKTKENTPEHAYLCYRIAMCYWTQSKTLGLKKYLIQSAISDIKSAIKDNTSLTILASILYREKDIDRAYEYIRFALNDANFFNARMRQVQVSTILPVINQAYLAKSESQKKKLRYYSLIITVLSLITMLAAVFIYRQMKNLSKVRNDLQHANISLTQLNQNLNHANEKLCELNAELTESNKIKEQYIALFLNICSTYINKLEHYRRSSNKLIQAGKVAELFENNKSKKLLEHELKEFYDNFDNTFLHIYPNFVEELNALLLSEERIILKKGELLNTELRIFALIRLGINDSSRIASLLRYSVNTIYNYRVKIKNKSSIPRDEFEKQVMKIGSL